VPLETFAAYGLEFQKRFVPELEQTLVTSVQRSATGFQIDLATGEVVSAQKVVVAVGISHFAHVPPILSALPEEFVSHSSKYHSLGQFKGREVAVVGAGASALDLAALLHQTGASVQVVARKPAIRFHDRGQVPRPLLESIRSPMTGIGPGWKLVFCANTPWAFHLLPEHIRLDAVRRILGPAPGWFIKDQVVGKVRFNLGVEIKQACIQNGRVKLELTDGSGARRMLVTDHVIAATGYRVDLRRLTFLNAEVQAGVRHVDQTPVLTSNFESSVPGLYFVGTSAASAFGPLMRFAFGARFAAVRLSNHLKRSSLRSAAKLASAQTVQAENRG
jgi:thioredoxin reductase